MKKMIIMGLVLASSVNQIFTAAETPTSIDWSEHEWPSLHGGQRQEALNQKLLDAAKPQNKQQVKQRSCTFVKGLLKGKANPNTQDAHGNTPLHYAVTPFWSRKQKHTGLTDMTYFTLKIMRLVLEGAELIQNHEGKTPEDLLNDWINSGMGDEQKHRNALNCLHQALDLKKSRDEEREENRKKTTYQQRGLEHGFVYNR